MKKILQIPRVLLIIFLMALYFFYPWEEKNIIDENETKDRHPNQASPQIAAVEEKLLPINEHLKTEAKKLEKKRELIKELEKDPEFQSSIEKYFKPLVTFSETLLADINFFGLVIDQNGEPVAGHKIIYNTIGAIYAEGSGPGETVTDASGRFAINDAKARTLYIESAKKNGYQFPRAKYLDHDIFLNTSEENPYIVNAWEIDRYPNIIKSKAFPKFIPDGRTYTLNFLDKKIVKEEDSIEGDLRVTFDRTDEQWNVVIEAVNGGLQETDDLYRYLAPVGGYKPSLSYQGTGKNKAKTSKNNIYFTSRKNKIYGTFEMEVWPYYRDKSGISLDYVINLEQGRNLAIKKY